MQVISNCEPGGKIRSRFVSEHGVAGYMDSRFSYQRQYKGPNSQVWVASRGYSMYFVVFYEVHVNPGARLPELPRRGLQHTVPKMRKTSLGCLRSMKTGFRDMFLILLTTGRGVYAPIVVNVTVHEPGVLNVNGLEWIRLNGRYDPFSLLVSPCNCRIESWIQPRMKPILF